MTDIFNAGNILSINDFDLYYEIHGKGYPLLLLHGFTGSGAALVQGFNQLRSDYQLIIPDLRGHGKSTNPSKKFTFQQAAFDIFALLDHLHIDQFSAVGFSGGGCTLLKMAYHQSEKIKSMMIVSAVPYFPKQTREIAEKYSIQNRTEDEWMKMRSIHFHGDEQIRLLWTQADAFCDSNDDMNFTPEMLSTIKTKTLIVQGDRDPFFPIELTIEMYKSIPNAYLWIIPNGGHVPVSVNAMQEFINYLKKYI